MAFTKEEAVEETATPDHFGRLLNEIRKLHETRNATYRNSPMNILPESYFLNQIVIKAMRAEQSIDSSKCEEELMDNIVYSMLVILRKRGVTV